MGKVVRLSSKARARVKGQATEEKMQTSSLENKKLSLLQNQSPGILAHSTNRIWNTEIHTPIRKILARVHLKYVHEIHKAIGAGSTVARYLSEVH